MTANHRTLALFYCRNVPGSSEADRQAIEAAHGGAIRLFPLPCSGRLDSVHLMRALEAFADAAYLITCPEGTCRYFEGNLRAKTRVERTRALIESIGLEGERVGMVMGSKDNPKPLAILAREIRERVFQLTPSPVLKRSMGSRREAPREEKRV
ncbi:MAG: hydrogenase iron-sulfur subunit, partial [Deltaproteobacteria bacterium]|nr:hydrogenase iron-sulfur subunit [Deltaproteobacteria bacterium]